MVDVPPWWLIVAGKKKRITRKVRVLNLTLIPCKENKIEIYMYFVLGNIYFIRELL
jgi:hypothetical protein